MRRIALAAVAACGAALASFADLGSGGHPPDGFATNDVAYARRGALGSDDYVVTNLWTQMPSYALVADGGTSLVDRAVNRFTVTNDVAFALPPVPKRRTYDEHRPARSFVVVTEMPEGPVREVSFTGAGRLYTDEAGIAIGTGVTILSFVEIGNGEFLVECRELKQLE